MVLNITIRIFDSKLLKPSEGVGGWFMTTLLTTHQNLHVVCFDLSWLYICTTLLVSRTYIPRTVTSPTISQSKCATQARRDSFYYRVWGSPGLAGDAKLKARKDECDALPVKATIEGGAAGCVRCLTSIHYYNGKRYIEKIERYSTSLYLSELNFMEHVLHRTVICSPSTLPGEWRPEETEAGKSGR